jgi:hypothetical protein
MSPLAPRKKLLIAESELNRAQLVQDWRMMADEVHVLTSRARTIGSLASAAASLVGGLVSFRHKKPATSPEKPSCWQTLLKGVGLVSTVWQSFHQQDCDQPDK